MQKVQASHQLQEEQHTNHGKTLHNFLEVPIQQTYCSKSLLLWAFQESLKEKSTAETKGTRRNKELKENTENSLQTSGKIYTNETWIFWIVTGLDIPSKVWRTETTQNGKKSTRYAQQKTESATKCKSKQKAVRTISHSFLLKVVHSFLQLFPHSSQ